MPIYWQKNKCLKIQLYKANFKTLTNKTIQLFYQILFS